MACILVDTRVHVCRTVLCQRNALKRGKFWKILKVTANLRSWKKSRKVMEFEELIRVRTMILSGGQTGKNISMTTVNCIRTFFCNWKVYITNERFFDGQE